MPRFEEGICGTNREKFHSTVPRAFKNNSHSSKYAKHLIEQNHALDSIQNTMQVLQYQNKGAHLNTYECFHIYAEYIKENHLNDEHTIFQNKLFDTLLKTPQ